MSLIDLRTIRYVSVGGASNAFMVFGPYPVGKMVKRLRVSAIGSLGASPGTSYLAFGLASFKSVPAATVAGFLTGDPLAYGPFFDVSVGVHGVLPAYAVSEIPLNWVVTERSRVLVLNVYGAGDSFDVTGFVDLIDLKEAG